jgi:hypothetical protein
MKNKRNLSLNYLFHLHDLHLDLELIAWKINIKQKKTEYG